MAVEALVGSDDYALFKSRSEDFFLKWHRHVWRFLRFLYNAESYGPKSIAGPAIVVFDKHAASFDGIILSCLESPSSMIAKKGQNPISWMARLSGAIMLDLPKINGRDSVLSFKDALEEQLKLRLNNKQVVGVFTYNDINEARSRFGVVKEAVMLEQRGLVPPVSYIPATTLYSSMLSTQGKLPYIVSKWPVPFITNVKLLLSSEPLLLSALPTGKQNAKCLVERLREESASLQARYLGR